ncbi:MAG: Ldh family oxidoreductase, partial [Alphaproteobacteria bacterium]|nr:Ldh family oxidoreductase [Alphaproteobacteria bacterium]
PERARRRHTATKGMLTIVIDPSQLIDRQWLTEEIAAISAHTTASPPMHPDEPVLISSDPERLTRAERIKNGVPRREDLARAHRRRPRRQCVDRSASVAGWVGGHRRSRPSPRPSSPQARRGRKRVKSLAPRQRGEGGTCKAAG